MDIFSLLLLRWPSREVSDPYDISEDGSLRRTGGFSSTGQISNAPLSFISSFPVSPLSSSSLMPCHCSRIIQICSETETGRVWVIKESSVPELWTSESHRERSICNWYGHSTAQRWSNSGQCGSWMAQDPAGQGSAHWPRTKSARPPGLVNTVLSEEATLTGLCSLWLLSAPPAEPRSYGRDPIARKAWSFDYEAIYRQSLPRAAEGIRHQARWERKIIWTGSGHNVSLIQAEWGLPQALVGRNYK